MFIHQCCSENMSAQEQRVTIWRKLKKIKTAEMQIQFDICWLYNFFRVAAKVQLLSKNLLKSKLDLDQLTEQIAYINHNVSKIPQRNWILKVSFMIYD